MKLSIEDINRIVRDAVDGGGVEELKLNESFQDQGLDSLDVSSLLLAVSEELGVEIPDEDIDQISSPEVLIRYLADK